MSNSYFFIAASVFAIILIIKAFFQDLPDIKYLLAGTVLFYSIGAFEYLYVSGINAAKFSEFIGEQVIIQGFVDSEPDIKQSKISYVIKTETVSRKGERREVRGRILLTTLKNDDKGPIFEYGTEIQVRGQLNAPRGKRNPGGFDYRNYLAQSGISATVFAREFNIYVGERRRGELLTRAGLMLRDRIVDVINKSLPEQQAGLLNGMLIGYRKGLSKEVQEAFSDSGLTHIMAVSGANVAFIVFPLVFVLRKLRIKQRTSNFLIIGVLIVFVYITGLEPSVVRAVIMAITVLTGQIIRRDADVFSSISFAAILMLIYNPYTLFNIGFQLSFAATLSLVMFYRSIRNMIKMKFIPGFVADTLAATLSAQAGVLPLSLLYFNKISLISIISNLVVVPVLELITILGSIMAVLGQLSIALSQMVGYVNCTFLTFVLYVTKISAGLPYAVVQVVTPSVWLVILYYIAICFLLWYKPMVKLKIRPLYYAAFFGAVAAAFFIQALIPRGLEVVFIDVGQGDSAFIRTCSGRTVLIDGGGSDSKDDSETNIGETVVIPFLLDYGVSSLDLVIATHGHNDHIQGLIPVLEEFGVENFAMPDYRGPKEEFKALLDICASRKIQVKTLKKGDKIKLDDKSFFDVLSPSKDLVYDVASLNNSSLVLKLVYEDVKVLFTGDMEKEAEDLLLDSPCDVRADVLKVAHHGSDTSTGFEFLRAVAPEAAVISVGRNNFGHPSGVVLKRLSGEGVLIFRTDEDGAVILRSDGRKISFTRTVNQ